MLNSVLDPSPLIEDNIAFNRENYINYCATESSITKNNKVCKQITYKIDSDSLQWLTKSSNALC